MSLKRKEPPISSMDDAKKPKKNGDLASFFNKPKATLNGTGAAAAGVPPKFDKDKWVATLTAEQRELLKLEIDTLDPSWLSQLKEEVTSKEFLELKRFLKKEIDSGQTVFPPLEDVYSWSRHTPLHTVKVVILGQDPYHNFNQAHGLCFSVRPPTPAPPSLKNMYIALKHDYPSFKPPPNNGGLLTPWAEQGVLMLNTCLTVRKHEANSHARQGWESFTQKVIDTVARVRSNGVVFLAWGSPAQKRCVKISGAKHIVLKAVHPSPLSAHKGFLDCGHFKKTNDWLETRYGKDGIINWDLNVQKPIKAADGKGPAKAVADPAPKLEKKTGPKTDLSGKKQGDTVQTQDEFEGEDDEDAIEAILEAEKTI